MSVYFNDKEVSDEKYIVGAMECAMTLKTQKLEGICFPVTLKTQKLEVEGIKVAQSGNCFVIS